MWAREFVRNLEYDAVPRTIAPIEQFISVVGITFDTIQVTKSQDVNCTECVVMVQSG